MVRKSKKKKTKTAEKVSAIVSILILITAWWFGGVKLSENQLATLNSLTGENQTLVKVEENLYQVLENDVSVSWLGIGQGIGYGGEIEVAVRIDNQGEINQISILSIKDTSSYITKVIEHGFVDKFFSFSANEPADVDAVSGATISSTGMLNAFNSSIELIGTKVSGQRKREKYNPLSTVSILDAVAIILFITAIYVSRSVSKHKTKMQWILMLSALGVLGFYSASLISTSTLSILISGSWIHGLGNYTPLILFILTIGYILLFNKNIYCQMICPMGTTQQCLSKLTNAKTVSLKHKVFVWFPRFLLLITLAGGLYFRNPTSFSYTPFGIMFSMVGSIYLFIPTILILLTSLVVHRPWCKTLCPINAMTDYILFFKDWYKQLIKPLKKRNKKRSKAMPDKKSKTYTPTPSAATNTEDVQS
ncbi:hypothetical protein MACH09_40210 [Vibrio sp. MACH09]|uniref:FMN-binding protein n=1 Tax=Vibrio sp. MACH09 TaxID=3025122 RepID=UPI002794A59B|nr:FMN-binding protein [Vibrio sp. MACH09]GLO63513.1 hypothetical protein MACH09_40210 [Vibrio sp. MACH09]